jgi:hypothetical protein
MAATSWCGDSPHSEVPGNLQESRKFNCSCYTQCKQELQGLLFELKSVTKNTGIPNDESNCDMIQINVCKKCNILLSQLQEAVTKLKSAQLIITLLQEEVNKSCEPCNWTESDQQNISEFSRHDWKLVGGKYSSKFTKCSTHSTLQDIATMNKYDVLSDRQFLSRDAQGKFPGKTNNITSRTNTPRRFHYEEAKRN